MTTDVEELIKAKKCIRELVDTLAEDGQFQLDVVTDALDFLRSTYTAWEPTSRGDLISQLRHALHLAQSPNEIVVEFEIGDTGFCFEYDEQQEQYNV